MWEEGRMWSGDRVVVAMWVEGRVQVVVPMWEFKHYVMWGQDRAYVMDYDVNSKW